MSVLIKINPDTVKKDKDVGSAYSFEYEDTDVECNGCGSKFTHNELEISHDGYSTTCCPDCGEIDCCEIQYQSLSEYRKSK